MALVLSSDSVTFALVIVAAMFLSSCLCAPTNPSEADPWWFQPCKTDPDARRHSRSTSNENTVVRRQLRIFNHQLKTSMNKIEVLYKSQSKIKLKSQLEWLKIKKMVRNIRNPKKEKLKEFYDALQDFAITLEFLRNVKVNVNANNFDVEKRHAIYQNITFQLRTLMCEVREILQSKKVVVKPTSMKKIQKAIRGKSELNLTDSQLFDRSFFKKAISFFKKTLELFSQSKKNRKVKSVNGKRTSKN